jgi:hypothetical protein
MVLLYKNFTTNHVLEQSRNIGFTLGNMVHSFNNTIESNYNVVLDEQQLFIQADVFARQILLHRSIFDLKRFLGSYQDDWHRLLMEAYVYDRLKAIYYGVNYNNIMSWPEGLVSFPGNILLSRLIAKKTFNHFTNDEQPFSFFINVSCENNLQELFKGVLSICPNLEQGLSNTPGFPSYVNSACETVLRGLFNGSVYLNSRKGTKTSKEGDLYQIFPFDTDKFDSKLLQDEFPFINSSMKNGFNEWFFYISDGESGVNALHFNESLFLGRAIGVCMQENLAVNSNNMYMVAPRNYESDPYTKEEVYAITGVKSELIPYDMDTIRKYLAINTYEINQKINISKLEDESTP